MKQTSRSSSMKPSGAGFVGHVHDDAVAVRVVERLLVPRFGIGLLDAVRPPSPATAERHGRLLGRCGTAPPYNFVELPKKIGKAPRKSLPTLLCVSRAVR